MFALGCYLAATFTPLFDGLDWLEAASPWTWAFHGDALAEGASATGSIKLFSATAALLLAGTWTFTRRDVGV